MTYQVLLHIHSVLRWLVLLGFVIVILHSFILLATRENESRAGSKIVSVSISLLHLQILFGIALYFISPKVVFSAASMSNNLLRFFLVEHITLMLLAAILVTAGVSGAKKISIPQKKHSRILIWFLIALTIILLAIPWPWRQLSAGWI